MKPSDVITGPRALEALGSERENLESLRTKVHERAKGLAGKVARRRDEYNKRRGINPGRQSPRNTTGILVLERRQQDHRPCLLVGCLDIENRLGSNGRPGGVRNVVVRMGFAYTAKQAELRGEPIGGVGWEQVGDQIMRVEWIPDVTEATNGSKTSRFFGSKFALSNDAVAVRDLLGSVDETITAFSEAINNSSLNSTLTPPAVAS